MNITDIQATPRVVEIVHPQSEENIGLRVTLLPDTDPKVKKVQREMQDRQFSKRKLKLTAAQVETNSFEQLVVAVSDWEWYGEDVEFEGGKPEFNEDNVRKVLKKAEFIREQLMDEFNNREAFYQG